MSVSTILAKANSLRKKGEVEKARELLTGVLKDFPKNTRVRNALRELDAKPRVSAHEVAIVKNLFDQSNFIGALAYGRELLGWSEPTFMLLNILGISAANLRQFSEAEKFFRACVELSPNSPEAYNNLAVALKHLGRGVEATEHFEKAISLNSGYEEAHLNLAKTLRDQHQLDRAFEAFNGALAANPSCYSAHNGQAYIFMRRSLFPEALASFDKASALNPSKQSAIAAAYHALRHMCDWNEIERRRRSGINFCQLGLQDGSVPPFTMLSVEDDPQSQLTRSSARIRHRFPNAIAVGATPTHVHGDRIRIGFFSSDIYDHATMYLISGLLREIDQTLFEVFLYSYGHGASDGYRHAAEAAVEHFIDVKDLSDVQIAEIARGHCLDVAVDLKGHTSGNRLEIFMYRPAPVQINYLGYPGSTGAEFIDYIVADSVVIPESLRKFYSEKVIYLPDTYQPNDNQRKIAQRSVSRVDLGLPENGFVFCCFNAAYKIDRPEFEIWMRVMARVENSVLWLLSSNEWAVRNLKAAAEARGVDGSRLVFAEFASHEEHLGRIHHADLFLDTFAVNAHTTASDALWAGVPIVTKAGHQFAARVAASLLTAVRLPELVCSDDDGYQHLALDLATDSQKYQKVRRRLQEFRMSAPLFDTRKYTRAFESGVCEAVWRHRSGHEPEDINIRSNVQ